MIVNTNRLGTMLGEQGFRLEYTRFQGGFFSRRSEIPLIVEKLNVSCAGPSHGIWYAAAATRADIGYGDAWIGDEKVLVEIASLPQGTTPLATDDDAIAWEKKVARLAPNLTRQWAVEIGPGLLERTKAACEAAAKYLAHAESFADVDTLEERLRRTVTEKQMQTADRLALNRYPKLASLASLIMAIYGEEVEGRPEPFEANNAEEKKQLAWRIVFLSALLNRVQESAGG